MSDLYKLKAIYILMNKEKNGIVILKGCDLYET